jgi:hypothetical protein
VFTFPNYRFEKAKDHRMNAPPIQPSNQGAAHASPGHSGGALEGMVRHVSEDGCQLILVGKAPNVGRRLSLESSPGVTISGTIRWVLGERVGFAFDHRISPEAVTQVTVTGAQLKAIRLLAEPVVPLPN